MRRSGKSRVLPTSKKMAANGEDILLHDRTPTRPNRLRPGLSARAVYQESVDKRQQKQKAPISRSQESLSWCNPSIRRQSCDCQWLSTGCNGKQVTLVRGDYPCVFSPKTALKPGAWTRRGSNPHLHHDRETCSHLHHGPLPRIVGQQEIVRREKLGEKLGERLLESRNGNAELVHFFIPLLAVEERQAAAQRHESHGRRQQHQNSTADGALPVLGSAGSRAIAHGAALAKSGTSPKHSQQCEHEQSQLHFTPS